MLIQYIVFAMALASFPAIGAIAIHFSNKQHALEDERARRAGGLDD